MKNKIYRIVFNEYITQIECDNVSYNETTGQTKLFLGNNTVAIIPKEAFIYLVRFVDIEIEN